MPLNKTLLIYLFIYAQQYMGQAHHTGIVKEIIRCSNSLLVVLTCVFFFFVIVSKLIQSTQYCCAYACAE